MTIRAPWPAAADITCGGGIDSSLAADVAEMPRLPADWLLTLGSDIVIVDTADNLQKQS